MAPARPDRRPCRQAPLQGQPQHKKGILCQQATSSSTPEISEVPHANPHKVVCRIRSRAQRCRTSRAGLRSGLNCFWWFCCSSRPTRPSPSSRSSPHPSLRREVRRPPNPSALPAWPRAIQPPAAGTLPRSWIRCNAARNPSKPAPRRTVRRQGTLIPDNAERNGSPWRRRQAASSCQAAPAGHPLRATCRKPPRRSDPNPAARPASTDPRLHHHRRPGR